MTRIRRYLLVLLPVLLVVGPMVTSGDDELAAFLLRKGDKAARTKRYEEAVDFYTRALLEKERFPEAAFALGNALEKAGRTRDAILAFRRCIQDVAGMPAASGKLKGTAARAKKAISRLGKGYARLDRIESDFVKRCMEFGRAHFNEHKGWSKRAFETAVRFDPGNATAARYLEKLKEITASRGDGVFDGLLPSSGRKGWSLSEDDSTEWTFTGGKAYADHFGTGISAWYDGTKFDGTYVLHASVSIGEPYRSDRWQAGLLLGVDYDESRETWFLISSPGRGRVVRVNGNTGTILGERYLPDFEFGETYRLRVAVKSGAASYYVNDTKIHEEKGQPPLVFKGYIGLRVCYTRAVFSGVGVVR